MTEISYHIPNGEQAASALVQTAELAGHADPTLVAGFGIDTTEHDSQRFDADVDTYAPEPGQNLRSITRMASTLPLPQPNIELGVRMTETDISYVCTTVGLDDLQPPIAEVEFYTLPYPVQSTPLTREHVAAVRTFAELLRSMGSATITYVGVNMAEKPPLISADIEDPDGTALEVMRNGVTNPEESDIDVDGAVGKEVSGALEMFSVAASFFRDAPARY